MKDNSIKIGFCVAYDWYLLKYAIPPVYKYADSICLSVDKDHISWGGEQFLFDEEAFSSFVRTIDTENKIAILKEDFHQSALTPMENEVRQRNCMAEHMGNGGWHIQLDADEYFHEFGPFVNYLRKTNVDEFTNVSCILITVFKRVDNGYLIIDPIWKSNLELIAIASRKPHYEHGRKNGYFNHITSFKIVHQSWARQESEIQQKVSNWGHKNDFKVQRFVDFWKSLDETNYKAIKNFHPIDPGRWPALRFIRSNSMEDLINETGTIDISIFSKMELMILNSKMISRLKHFMRLLWP
ncbi:MAG TPA: hypothetical protein VIT44_07850 [Cyclobacteriaceae bacterium]